MSSFPPNHDQSRETSIFEVNWNRDRSSDDLVRSIPNQEDSIHLAWGEVVASLQKDYPDFLPIQEFVAWMETGMPDGWSWDNPQVSLFLERLDQLEDLAWALDLKIAQTP